MCFPKEERKGKRRGERKRSRDTGDKGEYFPYNWLQTEGHSLSLHKGESCPSDAQYNSYLLICTHDSRTFSLSPTPTFISALSVFIFLSLLYSISYVCHVNASFAFSIPNLVFSLLTLFHHLSLFSVHHNSCLPHTLLNVNATQPQEIHSLLSLLTTQAWPH